MKSYVEAFDLTGKNALITGGGTGLGFAMARCLASAGDFVGEKRKRTGYGL